MLYIRVAVIANSQWQIALDFLYALQVFQIYSKDIHRAISSN